MIRTYGEVVHHPNGEKGRPEWSITAEPHVMGRLKRIFPRASIHRTGTITLADTPEVASDLTWVLERWPMTMTANVARRLEDRSREYDEARDAVTSILDGNTPTLTDTEWAAEVREYQLAAAEIVRRTGRLLLCDELGLGKTFSALLVLRDPEALPALVVTMTHLPAQWLAALNTCLPWLRGHIINKSTVYDPARARGANGYEPDVLIANYHKLAGWADHLAGKVATVIFDEAQELRHDGTRKYIAAAQIADGATFRMGLTATPIYNYGGEVHNVVSVLDPDALGTKAEFTREWCTGQSDKLAVKNPAALGAHLREEGLMLRRERTDVGRELPPVQRIPHTIPLDERVLEDRAAGARQLAELILSDRGSNTDRWKAAGDLDWRLRHATGIAKSAYVAEFVNMLLETEEPVVLFGWHHEVYASWARRLEKHNPVFFTGEETTTQKRAAQEAFMNGDTNLLVMSLRSGAGLDGLQDRAHVVVFGELDWSPGVHEQCIGRLHRDGQDDPVVAYFLIADSGADPVIADVLNLKKQQAQGIIDPTAKMFTEAAGNQDRIKDLARDYLHRIGARAMPAA